MSSDTVAQFLKKGQNQYAALAADPSPAKKGKKEKKASGAPKKQKASAASAAAAAGSVRAFDATVSEKKTVPLTKALFDMFDMSDVTFRIPDDSSDEEDPVEEKPVAPKKAKVTEDFGGFTFELSDDEDDEVADAPAAETDPVLESMLKAKATYPVSARKEYVVEKSRRVGRQKRAKMGSVMVFEKD